MSPEIEEFAESLIRNVRDVAIRSNDRNLSASHVIARRWREAAASGSPETLASVLIPDIVDSTISHLLVAIDQELLRLSFTAANGKHVDLTIFARESGELSGWYYGAGGWCEKYTKERFVDDFSDLNDSMTKPPGGIQE